MNRKRASIMPRREFLMSGSLWISGSCLLTSLPARGAYSQAAASLPADLSAAEREAVDKSAMAKGLEGYFGQGYSCAESLLMVGLRYLRLPEEFVWAAAGFGGGMQHREACGFLTAGIMDLGLAAGRLKTERPESKEWSKQKVNDYWSWWTAHAPIRCADIRKEGTSSTVCRRLGLLAAARVEELISLPKVPA